MRSAAKTFWVGWMLTKLKIIGLFMEHDTTPVPVRTSVVNVNVFSSEINNIYREKISQRRFEI